MKLISRPGVVSDMVGPIDGDVMFGMTYSEATGNFTGIMNYYLRC